MISDSVKAVIAELDKMDANAPVEVRLTGTAEEIAKVLVVGLGISEEMPDEELAEAVRREFR